MTYIFRHMNKGTKIYTHEQKDKLFIKYGNKLHFFISSAIIWRTFFVYLQQKLKKQGY